MLQSSFVLALAGLASFTSAAPHKRLAGGKRGLGFAKGLQDKAHMFTGSGKVSWAYDWEARVVDAGPGFTVPGVEFVPMLHDGSPMFTNAFASDCKGALGAGSKHILSVNEPDICGNGGTCMSVAATVSAHRDHVMKCAAGHPDVTVVSPAYSNAGVEAMKQFLAACTDCRIDHIATHWYGPSDIEAFKAHVTNVHNITKKPIWVTEFASHDGSQQFLQKAMAWMDSQEWIYRYAYFSVESALTAGNVKTPLGATYSA